MGSPCAKTCQNPGSEICIAMCEPKCTCQKGYIMDEEAKKCVKECPKKEPDCGVGGIWNKCGSACERTCQNPGSEVCTEQCVPKCTCTEGYLMDEKSKKCVKECP